MSDASAFATAERRYRDLLARYQRGEMDATAFQRAQMECTVQDAQGRSWLPTEQPGQWYLWNGQQWVVQPLPAMQGPIPPAYPPPPQGAGASAPGQAAAPVVIIQQQERRKRGPGCGGCFLIALVVLVLLGAAGVWLSPLSIKWGIRKSPAVKLLGTPDRAAADMLRLEMIATGMPIDGVESYVLPIKGEDTKALYTIVDASQGFSLAAAGVESGDALVDMLIRLANSDTVNAEGISRIALEYRDESGQTLAVMTAPTDMIRGFANGTVTREDFMKALDGRVDARQIFGGGL